MERCTGSAALGLKPSVHQTAPSSPVSILGLASGDLLGADNSCLGALGGGPSKEQLGSCCTPSFLHP